MSAKTVFVHHDGEAAGEIGHIFVGVYEGLLLDVDGETVIVTSVDWDIAGESTTCRLGIAPAPAELLRD
jgi:hypothetical protein